MTNLIGSAQLGSKKKEHTLQPSPKQGIRDGPLLAAVLMAICPLFISLKFGEDTFIVPRVFILSLATVLIWIASFSIKLHKPLLTIPILTFLGVTLITSLTSTDPLVSVFGEFHSPFHALIPTMLCVLIYFAFALTDIPIEQFGSATLYCSIYISMWAIMQKFRGVGLQDGRASSGFGSPVYLGNYIALILPLAWIWIREHKILGVVSLIFGFLAAIASRARGGIGAGIFGIIVYEYLIGNKRQVMWTIACGLLLLLVWHPIHHDSDMGRLEMWEIAIRGWLDKPFFGWGPDNYGLIFRRYETPELIKHLGGYKLIALQAHHDILQILCTMGIIGLSAYLFLAFRTMKMLWLDGSIHAKSVTALLTAIWCQAQVNPVHIIVLAYLAAFIGTIRSHEYI